MSVHDERQLLRDMIDALRLCLGLAPLYRDERVGLPRPVLYSGQMGEGCRRAPRGIKT